MLSLQSRDLDAGLISFLALAPALHPLTRTSVEEESLAFHDIPIRQKGVGYGEYYII
jgi:hypothetical protein